MNDEKTGGLSGLDGILPSQVKAAAQGLTGLRMPERLNGVLVDGAGRAVGLDLPALGDREVVGAWRAQLAGAPLYARAIERRKPLPIVQVQRLARVGELWLDAPLPTDDVGFDLLVAGAHRLVLWPGETPDIEGLLESFGDSAVLGWDGRHDWAATVALATAHAVPLLLTAEAPGLAPGLDLYRADLSSKGRFTVERTQAAQPNDPATPGLEPDDDPAHASAGGSGE